jgi:hypothetical protein
LDAVENERRAVVVGLDDARRAEHQAAQVVERIDRDYTAGDLSPANYERLSPRVASELTAARAQREQIERRMAELDTTAPEIDEIVAAHFGDLRGRDRRASPHQAQRRRGPLLAPPLLRVLVVRDDEGTRAIVANLRNDVDGRS